MHDLTLGTNGNHSRFQGANPQVVYDSDGKENPKPL